MSIGATSRTPKDTRTGAATFAADQGIPHLCGAGAPGISVQQFLMESAGSPETIVFADVGLSNMADGEYLVFVKGHLVETTNVVYASAKTAVGMTLTDGVAAEMQNVLIIGRLAGQLGPNGP